MLMVFQWGSFDGTVAEDVGHQAHRGRRWEDVGAASDILLEDIVLHRAAQNLWIHALLARHGDHHRQQDARRCVDRHADADPIQGYAVEQRLHVGQRGDRHAHAAHLAQRQRVVRIVADLRRQVEGDA